MPDDTGGSSDSSGIYLRVRDMYPQSVLLESSDYHTSQNSFSFIGDMPLAHFTVAQEKVSYTYPDGGRTEIQVDSSVDVLNFSAGT